ncbi:DNA-protecting protein DprA [Candidatus Woesebacteria bacterium]|nr:DNA-protecting protein DprA [Candidatus Woesebacteria bacterium]
MSQKEYLILLSSFVDFGPLRVGLLLKYFGSAKKIWEASFETLLKTGLGEGLTKKFIFHRNRIGPANYFERLNKLGISCLTVFERNYPKNLKEIDDAPYVLYVKGKIKKEDEDAVAVIGSRRMTSYGKSVTGLFSKELALSGVTIISGLARGVDTEAHKGALEAGGRTIAVLGAGLDRLYPPENLSLAREITDRGALVSEYPPGYPIRPFNFVARNRIVSGLSKAVLVIEGEEKSGTLITATHAANQGRSVFAVPGQITSSFSGAPHFLIKNGAKMVSSVADIFEEGEVTVKKKVGKAVLSVDADERKILSFLEKGPLQLDKIARISSLEAPALFVKLTEMETKGFIKNLGGGVYRRTPPSKLKKK